MSERLPAPASWTVYGALVLVQIFFGVHYLAAKVVLQEIPAPLWALIRVAAGAAVLLGIALALGRPLPRSPSVLGRLAVYALFGVVINQLCFVLGLARTSPTHSSVLVTSIPVATLLFALLLGRERPNGPKLLSLAVAVSGALLVIVPRAGEPLGGAVAGDVLILVNALSYALFLVISRGLLRSLDALSATAVLLAFGTLGMLLPGLSAIGSFDVRAVSMQTWWLAGYIVLCPTAAGYLLTYWALARVESSTVALFIYLQPIIATLLSVALLGERPEARTVLGAALIFAAVYRKHSPYPVLCRVA